MKRFLFLITLSLLLALPSQGQKADAPSLRYLQSEAIPSLNRISSVQLAGLDAADLRKDNPARPMGGPLRYGVVRPVSLSPGQHGTWMDMANGDRLWRGRIESPGALNLSVQMQLAALPDGAEAYVYGADYDDVRGPYRARDAVNGQLWTPHVNGETLVVEVLVPAEAAGGPALDGFSVSNLMHGYRNLDRLLRRGGVESKSGACNVDVACSEADPWRDQVGSVVSYTFMDSGSGGVCTGSLVNKTGTPYQPYVLTAEHCVSTEDAANSMVLYFNYQNQTCRTPGSSASGSRTNDDRTDQTMSGARLLMDYGNFNDRGSIDGRPDVTLVRMNDPVTVQYAPYFNGWSIEDRAPASAVTIHHPAGDGKRISFEDDPTSITSYARDVSPTGPTHIRIADWNLGTTEGGSSGAPLYDQNQRVVGVLSGGRAACGNNLEDWYGRISEAWEGGGTPETRLRDWLDPENSVTSGIDGRPYTDTNDDTAPGSLGTLTTQKNETASEITIEWTATGDDGSTGQAIAYEFRYDNEPIESIQDFENAFRVLGIGSPKASGSPESVTLSFRPELPFYFAVIAYDDNLNRSPLATTNTATVLSDVIPPNQVTDLSVQSVEREASELTLTWTAPGDDGDAGRVESYDVRRSTRPIRTEADFNAAETINAPVPGVAGTLEQLVVAVERGTPYYFAIRATDNVGNTSRVGFTEQAEPEREETEPDQPVVHDQRGIERGAARRRGHLRRPRTARADGLQRRDPCQPG